MKPITRNEEAMEIRKRNSRIAILVIFMMIMISLGVSDALRGIFAEVFEEQFQLSKVQVSWIVTASYVGNLLFMLLGGRWVDRVDKKKACIGIMMVWSVSMLIFINVRSYGGLLFGMFLAMGASTLMNTMMNILSPVLFGTLAGTFVNLLFFVQGIGTSGSQKLGGIYARSFGDFAAVCGTLMVIGVVASVLLWRVDFPEDGEKRIERERERIGRERERIGGEEESERKEDERRGNEEERIESAEEWIRFKNKKIRIEEKRKKNWNCKQVRSNEKSVKSQTIIVLFGLLFGFYFVAEHGIMNWWALYCKQGLMLSSNKASTSVALFFGGITVGRLLFAPVVGKIGVAKSLKIMGGIGMGLYIIGICLGRSGVYLMGISGVFLSILYPTMVLNLQAYFPKKVIATMTGIIISIGTIFDIAFNASYGYLVESVGFRVSIYIFPCAMVLFYGLLLFILADGAKQGN